MHGRGLSSMTELKEALKELHQVYARDVKRAAEMEQKLSPPPAPPPPRPSFQPPRSGSRCCVHERDAQRECHAATRRGGGGGGGLADGLGYLCKR